MPQFDDLTIEQIFGADDAENEKPERFKEYFYRNRAYDSLVATLPVRILVGHKGIGKSALLKRAYLDDLETNNPCLWLRPNDIVEILTTTASEPDFIRRIELWKKGLLLEIVEEYFSTHYGPDLYLPYRSFAKLSHVTFAASSNEPWMKILPAPQFTYTLMTLIVVGRHRRTILETSQRC